MMYNSFVIASVKSLPSSMGDLHSLWQLLFIKYEINLICEAFMLLGLSFFVTSCVKGDLAAVEGNQQGVSTIKLNVLSNSEVITRTTVANEARLMVNSGYIFVLNNNKCCE